MQISICRRADPLLSTIISIAEDIKTEVHKEKMRDALYQRAVEGIETPLIGRIARDEDGIVATTLKYSDRLLEFAMRNRDDKYKDSRAGTGANINNGTQVQLNVWIPPHLADEASAPAPATGFEGGNGAEIIVEEAE